jgi:hypothetical protein
MFGSIAESFENVQRFTVKGAKEVKSFNFNNAKKWYFY